MPSCEICTRVVCRGGLNCASFRRLNEIKLRTAASGSIQMDLSGLALKSLPRDYFLGMEHVYDIILFDNDFEYLPWWTFQHLPILWSLKIDNNPRLLSISDALWEVADTLGALECYDCTHLCSDTWLFKIRFPRLIKLRLVNCGLNNIPATGFFNLKMPRLELLDLSGNGIKAIRADAFRLLRRLRHLDLSFNRLTAFDPACLAPTSHLQTLDLNNNRLASLPPLGATPATTALTDINVANNRIRDLPADTFTGLLDLTTVDLQGNFLVCLRAGLFATQPAIDINLNCNRRLQYIDPECFGAEPIIQAEYNPCLALEGCGATFLARLLEVQEELDAILKKSRFEAFHEDLLATVYHPSRIEKLLATHGFEALEAF